MVHDNVQIRRQGAQDFMAYYEFACARQDSVPLSAVTGNLDKGMLDFSGDRLKPIDWPPILGSISINKHLHHIAISSNHQANSGDSDRKYYKSTFRKKIPVIRSKDITFKLCKALKECLTVSSNLKTLKLVGLPLRERDLITLTKGLGKSTSLETFSLANCPISDEGLEVICQSVKYSTTIRAVDFTGCSLTWRGAEHLANIIKHQGMQRHGTAWAESLRYRLPKLEGMAGLRRITLNSNSLIGDQGAAALAHELAEDLWVKAVDLQRCGLSNEGARCLLEALKTNSSLCVLDIRNNPLVDKAVMRNMIETVLKNPGGQSPEYCWIKPPSPEPHKAFVPKRRPPPSTVRGKATCRIATHKGASGGRVVSVSKSQTSWSRSSYVPWRAAARAGRQRGLPPGIVPRDQSFQAAASVKITVESDSEEEDDEDDYEGEVVVEIEKGPSSSSLQDRITERHFEIMQMELKECRLRLAEERRARLKAQSKLVECELEIARLRDANQTLSEALVTAGSTSAPAAFSALEDEAILESIESSFTKFHAFLDLLKDAGLGQLASMAGIDNSDFQPLGRPQLSSTLTAPTNRAALGTRVPYEDVEEKTDVLPLESAALPAFSAGLGNATITPTSQPPVRAPLLNDVLLDGTLSPPPEPAAEPRGAGAEEIPDPYSKPDSGSDHSVHGQMSFGKTFLPRSNSNSHKSNGSHANSYKNSFSHHHASRSRSRGSSSVSGSDVISDQAESEGSAGSRSRGAGLLVSVGLPGSEGSQSKARLGRAAVEHIRAGRQLEGQSDDDSF